VWWIAFTWLLLVFLIDLFFLSSHRQVINSYVPMVIFLSILAATGLCVFFHTPERFWNEQRMPQLYFQSHFWFALAYLFLIYEYQVSLYVMFKYDE
jgi:hypothetical protein